ncbi:MAG: alpha/beta hydrolase, partial [Rhodospirillales bacterium]|nr:alpha/beta hydrolase [Rhodospirillales bacterium]
MRSVGAMPNNLPGLLPFLAAEILRGRKVVIFPEGGMVKDRRVIDGDGDFGIFSRTAEERRKHHRGAAVLALTLDIFKRRIRDLITGNDIPRLERWVKSLGLESIEVLRDRANEPTLIVPANITFYPIRIDKNFLSRGAEMLAKGLSNQFIEELVIEGNLLFRDTDMDIRFGAPVEPKVKWRWWQRVMLQRYFQTVTSLDDLFGLREDEAENRSERILAKGIAAETDRIRDEAMAKMYAAITVNLSHLASGYISRLIDRGIMEIEAKSFHRGLYLALKNLQATKDVHLHRSLYWPDRYRGLLDGDCFELDRFLKICEKAKLIECVQDAYRFTDKLKLEQEYDNIRLENPLLVYANEVAPIRAVGETLDAALQNVDTVTEMELASFLFDDELRGHDWNKRHYSTEKFREINDQETATENGAPYLF